MNVDFKEHILLQTFIDLDRRISNLEKRLKANRYIELGDDPRLVQEIENAMVSVYRRARSIEPYFNLSYTPLRRANVYFSLIKQVNEALKYLRDVRNRDYGSRQQTHEFLGKLENCLESLYAIGDIISVSSETVH
jgi:hypothetical protein